MILFINLTTFLNRRNYFFGRLVFLKFNFSKKANNHFLKYNNREEIN